MIMLSPKFSACAGPFKKYNNLKATERVATTPLYYLCNSRGQSFIQEDNQIGNPDQRAMVYFMSSKDATNYLQEMAQAMGGNANELRINTVSMEKVLDQIRSKKQSRKLGRIPLDINIRIQPAKDQISRARWITRLQGKVFGLGKLSIPVFSAQRLVVKRSNGEHVIPYYFAYEDLVDDWKYLNEEIGPKNKAFPKRPKVQVNDFANVMCLAEGITPSNLLKKELNIVDSETMSSTAIREALLTPGFVPPRSEIEMIRKKYRHQDSQLRGEYSQARLHTKP